MAASGGVARGVMSSSEPAARAVAEEVVRWGSMKQTGVTLRYMMEFGSRPTERNLLLSAQFLQKELPIRFARRAIELESLPFGLSNKPAILKVPSLSTPSMPPMPLPPLSLSMLLQINLAIFSTLSVQPRSTFFFLCFIVL